jgi:hypothetical protein
MAASDFDRLDILASYAANGSTIENVTWTMEYNGLNQLTKRYSGASWTGASGDVRYSYTYDTNGNLTGLKSETKIGSVWNQVDRWAYTWTTRDQMKYATKYNAADAYAGRVAYKYCLSCDGALSERIEYNSSWGEVSHKRYDYDGLNLDYQTNAADLILLLQAWHSEIQFPIPFNRQS